MIEGYGRSRSRRYVSGVVVLSRKDAFFVLSTVLDKQSMSKVLRGSNEDLIDSLRAIGLASSDFQAACINARKPAKKDESNQELDQQWFTPIQIADQLGVTQAAINQALRDGRLAGTKVDGRWRIRPADFHTYQASRLERRTS